MLERTKQRALAQAPGRMELRLTRTGEGCRGDQLRRKIRSSGWGTVSLEWLLTAKQQCWTGQEDTLN